METLCDFMQNMMKITVPLLKYSLTWMYLDSEFLWFHIYTSPKCIWKKTEEDVIKVYTFSFIFTKIWHLQFRNDTHLKQRPSIFRVSKIFRQRHIIVNIIRIFNTSDNESVSQWLQDVWSPWTSLNSEFPLLRCFARVYCSHLQMLLVCGSFYLQFFLQ